jgi:hypothetical protein
MVNANMEALTSAKSFNESHRRSMFRSLFDPIVGRESLEHLYWRSSPVA